MGPVPANVAVCLMGPTATGKTELALALADRLPVGLISVDSAMVYRHLDIGTGKPSPEVLARHPHRLVDIREPWEQYSAGEFVRDASEALEQIRVMGQMPLLVGGTLLYFRSLTDGLSVLPAANPHVRAELERRAARDGWAALHAELSRVDPAAAARISIHDRQRVQRALEVWLLTGCPISELQARRRATPNVREGGKFLKIGLVPRDRKLLGVRIARRFGAMLDRGFIAEVEALLSRPEMQPDSPALRAVGYRQIAHFVGGFCSRAEAEEHALAATRQLAKRQLTWLRREACDYWLDMASETLVADLEEVLSVAVPRMQNQH